MMLTRIEIDGFKTFENFVLDLNSFSAIVGPNASGKSNLFDALRLLSSLAQHDIRSAMQNLRGEPQELFRRTQYGLKKEIKFAVEVILDPDGIDAFGTKYDITGQRVRYELDLALKTDSLDNPRGIFVTREACIPMAKRKENLNYVKSAKINYTRRKTPFINMRDADNGSYPAFEIRQDGPTGDTGATKRGRPITLPAAEATRTALSTISTAEFPHLYALRDMFANIRFLEINPLAARQPSDRFASKTLKPDASNLAAVLARLKDETSSEDRPDGVLSDISMDLSLLIPSVMAIDVFDIAHAKEYSFGVKTTDGLGFSSRVISDGTLRILALLTILGDPNRRGVLCFEEPENGVHEGRIPSLINFLRSSAAHPLNQNDPDATVDKFFQILINTHSPAVMMALGADEIVVADAVSVVDPMQKQRTVRTRMRNGIFSDEEKINQGTKLTRSEISKILRNQSSEA